MSWPACLYVKALHAYCYIRPIFFCQAGLILILSCINACSVSCHNTNLRNFLFKIKALRSHTSCLILGNILQINLILAQAYILQDPSASYLFFLKMYDFMLKDLCLYWQCCYTPPLTPHSCCSESQMINHCFSLESQYYQLLFHVRSIHAKFWNLETEFWCEFT